MRMDSEIKKIIKKYEKYGWYLHREGKHYIYKNPRGGTVTVSKSASTQGAFKAIERDFKSQEREWKKESA